VLKPYDTLKETGNWVCFGFSLSSMREDKVEKEWISLNILVLMGVGDSWDTVVSPPPTSVVPLNLERDYHWRHFDNSMNAVSFGFVTTAILISMFLVIAIFERFLRPRSLSSSAGANGSSSPNNLEAQVVFQGKLDFPSPKVLSLSLSLSLTHTHTHTHTQFDYIFVFGFWEGRDAIFFFFCFCFY